MELNITPHLTTFEKLKRQVWRIRQRRALARASFERAGAEVSQTPSDGAEPEYSLTQPE